MRYFLWWWWYYDLFGWLCVWMCVMDLVLWSYIGCFGRAGLFFFVFVFAFVSVCFMWWGEICFFVLIMVCVWFDDMLLYIVNLWVEVRLMLMILVGEECERESIDNFFYSLKIVLFSVDGVMGMYCWVLKLCCERIFVVNGKV